MLAYHNDPKIKESILLQLQAHYDADEFIKGKYWENGKGCAVGCTIHGNNYTEYETRFGIPQVLAKFEDEIFEGLPNSLAKEWPIKFMSAINVGSDLSNVWKKFIIWLLCDPKYGVINYAKTQQSKNAINLVCDLYKDWLLKDIEPQRFEEVKEIARAAYDDADAVVYTTANAYVNACAAYTAYTAYTACAACAADATHAATRAATRAAAAHAATRAAKQDHYIAQSEKLLELLREEI